MKYLFSANRLLCFILSAMMSFLFYASLAGSNTFFWWFNGIVAVCFDLTRLQLWDSGETKKKFVAMFFIAFSIFAFAGITLSETLRETVKEVDSSYIESIEKDIETLDILIAQQAERIANTSADYGTAAQKENEILSEYRQDRKDLQQELRDHSSTENIDESASSFQIYSNFFDISISSFMLIFYMIRAILLESAILFTGRKKEKVVEKIVEVEKVVEVEKIVEKEVSPIVKKIETDDIETSIKKWLSNSRANDNANNIKVFTKLQHIVDTYKNLMPE